MTKNSISYPPEIANLPARSKEKRKFRKLLREKKLPLEDLSALVHREMDEFDKRHEHDIVQKEMVRTELEAPSITDANTRLPICRRCKGKRVCIGNLRGKKFYKCLTCGMFTDDKSGNTEVFYVEESD